MKKYESFNPNIPEPEEQPQNENLPLYQEEISDKVEKIEKSAKKDKEKRQKSQKEKPSKREGESFPDKVKKFAGSQTTRWLLGLLLGFFGLYLGVSFFSYITECVKDQSEIYNNPVGFAGRISNSGGEGGARISEFLINECFGIGSAVIVFWLIAMSLKLLVGKPRFKSVNFTIKSIVALITISIIVGVMTVGMDNSVNWGGYHGRFVNEYIIHFIGWSGAVLFSIFLLCCFIVICLRDLINWIIRKHKEYKQRKRDKELEEEAKLNKERELEEMRKNEEVAAVQAGDAEIPEEQEEADMTNTSQVTFDEDDSCLYTSLPDFDETEEENEEMPEEDMPISETTDGTITTFENDGDSIATTIPELYSEVDENSTSSEEELQENEKEEASENDDMVVNVNEISQMKQKRESEEDSIPGMHPYKFPPAELLREGTERISVDANEQIENKEKIKKTLLDFGISIVSIEATVGPTVTLYEIVPDRGVKINRIRNLVDDIALSLAATGVRIIAPIPGKGTVGIEVANKDAQTVSMRTVIKSHKYQESKYKLPIAIGSTISNEVYMADLAKMPHLLVAGATGQGKSVGLNAIIASLLYRKTPDELKFVMIDPKMVEFSLYAKIEAHYLAKIPDTEDAIITDMEKVVATLSSLCVEMDNRYQLLKAAHTRNIEEYNEKIKQRRLNPLEGHRFLPYIVVVVDEFSDLIMTAGKEVEIPIARLAQKARAVGIHVIIATQRPSTNVITGIIKANFPARIAFKVSSGVDSKTILDTPGAQQLIGRGDMLISNNAPMVRVQCAFIDTPEVEAICDYISRQPYGQGAYELPEPVTSGSGDNDSELGNNFGDRDPLFEEAARLIVTSNTASTSSLQRRYSIGYNRAGKIMDQLEAAGIVGPAHGGKPRSVLVDAITLESILGVK